MSPMLAVARGLCAIVLAGLGIFMAMEEAWIACICVALVAWDDRPDVFRRRA